MLNIGHCHFGMWTCHVLTLRCPRSSFALAGPVVDPDPSAGWCLRVGAEPCLRCDRGRGGLAQDCGAGDDGVAVNARGRANGNRPCWLVSLARRELCRPPRRLQPDWRWRWFPVASIHSSRSCAPLFVRLISHFELVAATLTCAAMLARRAASSAVQYSRRRVLLSGGGRASLRGRCACASSSSSSSSGGGGGSGSAAAQLPQDARAPPEPEPEPEPESPLVRDINKAMAEMPFSCIGYVMACRYAVFFPVVGLVKALSLPVPTELALAYVLTRPLVKLRFPVELGVAALLAKAVPALTQVKVSALLGLLPPPSAHSSGPFYSVPDYLSGAF